MHSHTHSHTLTHTHTHLHTHTCPAIHTHTHTCMHTRTLIIKKKRLFCGDVFHYLFNSPLVISHVFHSRETNKLERNKRAAVTFLCCPITSALMAELPKGRLGIESLSRHQLHSAMQLLLLRRADAFLLIKNRPAHVERL